MSAQRTERSRLPASFSAFVRAVLDRRRSPPQLTHPYPPTPTHPTHTPHPPTPPTPPHPQPPLHLPPSPLMPGEYGQEKQLLGPSFQVYPCKAALFNLVAQGGAAAFYANSVVRALRVPALRHLMVQLPAAVEGLREQLNLSGSFFRAIR